MQGASEPFRLSELEVDRLALVLSTLEDGRLDPLELITEPVDSTMINSTPRIALIRVKTLPRTISETLRAARVGTSLVLPSATRWATSASERPTANATLTA